MSRWLVNGRIFDGQRIFDGGAVQIADGRIAALVDHAPDVPADQCVDLGGHLLAPGFVDVQVNGGGGVLFNADPSPAGIGAIARAHRRFGTTSLLPTLISDDWPTMTRAADAVAEALAVGMPGIRGIHFEGPYLNSARRGCHREGVIRPVDDGAPALMGDKRLGTVVLTLAPEQVPPETIADLVAAGVLVCAGHSDAEAARVEAALAAGMRGFTHLYNAMRPIAAREPGVLGAALDHGESWCGIIVDGFHVSASNLRLALAAKPAGKVMLVTDAMPSVGHDQDHFDLMGETIIARGGRCLQMDGTIAGSDLDMATAVRKTMEMADVFVEEALRMASLYPAQFLGLENRIGRIAQGWDADLVLLDEHIRVLATWIGGVYQDHRRGV